MFNLGAFEQYAFPSRDASTTYVLDVARTANGIATTSTDQRLTLFDPFRLSAGPLASVVTDHGNITVMKVLGDGKTVCTAGENGTVAVWSFETPGKIVPVAQFQASQAPIASMACSAENNLIAVGTELKDHTASIFLWDVSGTPAQKAHYQEVHSDDVTELAFHATQPFLLLSGSTDGLVNVYDTRITDEDEVTIQTLNHNASVHHAAFLAPGSEVLAISHDEKFALYDFGEERTDGNATHDFGDLREVLGCQYVANITPKMDGAGAIIGCGAHEQQIFQLVFLAKGPDGKWTFDTQNSVGLPGGHGEELVRAFCFFDEQQMVITVGEDGLVKSWKA